MASIPRVGDEYAGYRIESVLGKGGMSVVYRAENIRTGTEVALKIMAPELAEDDTFRERFVRESRVAASINHPSVITIYDAGSADGLLYIAMRYIRDGDLKAVLRADAPLDVDRTFAIVAQVGNALDEAHSRDLIHRDVKPANILLYQGHGSARDHVFLTDFGLTKHSGSQSGLTGTGQFVGTIDYSAPEQIQGHPVDHRVDIYSLGCVLYECLTGTPPFKKESEVAVIWAHMQEEALPPSSLRGGLSLGVDAVLGKAMAKSPSERYQTCAQLLSDLRTELQAIAREDVVSGGRGGIPMAERTGPGGTVGSPAGSGRSNVSIGTGQLGGPDDPPTELRSVMGSRSGRTAPSGRGAGHDENVVPGEADRDPRGEADPDRRVRTRDMKGTTAPSRSWSGVRSRRAGVALAIAIAVIAAGAGLAVGRFVFQEQSQSSRPPITGGSPGSGPGTETMGAPCKIGGETMSGDSLACALSDHIPNSTTRSETSGLDIEKTCAISDNDPIPGRQFRSEVLLKCQAPNGVTVFYGIYHDRREVATDYQAALSFVLDVAQPGPGDYGHAEEKEMCTTSSVLQEHPWFVRDPATSVAIVHLLVRPKGQEHVPIVADRGRYACFVAGGEAYIVWSDSDLSALMVAVADATRRESLFDEWRNDLGPDHPGSLEAGMG